MDRNQPWRGSIGGGTALGFWIMNHHLQLLRMVKGGGTLSGGRLRLGDVHNDRSAVACKFVISPSRTSDSQGAALVKLRSLARESPHASGGHSKRSKGVASLRPSAM